jgi:hypothetical protein
MANKDLDRYYTALDKYVSWSIIASCFVLEEFSLILLTLFTLLLKLIILPLTMTISMISFKVVKIYNLLLLSLIAQIGIMDKLFPL